ncbi:hypothetical protein K1719_015015 [Acacia pycnantha]|nr:hypothetical protein K1719_015015 [Acacia pycnantha]
MKASTIVLCTLVLLVVVAEVQVSMAVTCSPVQLSACVSAITSSTPPSQLCCSKIKEQKPCLCQYVKNPNLKKFVDSPNARKVASTCGTPFPSTSKTTGCDGCDAVVLCHCIWFLGVVSSLHYLLQSAVLYL